MLIVSLILPSPSILGEVTVVLQSPSAELNQLPNFNHTFVVVDVIHSMITSLPYFLALFAGNRSESVSKRSFCDAAVVTETTACAIEHAITPVRAYVRNYVCACENGCACVIFLAHESVKFPNARVRNCWNMIGGVLVLC